MDDQMKPEHEDLGQPSPSSAKTDPKKVRNALLKMVVGAGAVALVGGAGLLSTHTSGVPAYDRVYTTGGVLVETRLSDTQTQSTSALVERDRTMPGKLPAIQVELKRTDGIPMDGRITTTPSDNGEGK